jgi:hypothetical protein
MRTMPKGLSLLQLVSVASIRNKRMVVRIMASCRQAFQPSCGAASLLCPSKACSILYRVAGMKRSRGAGCSGAPVGKLQDGAGSTSLAASNHIASRTTMKRPPTCAACYLQSLTWTSAVL